MSQTTSPPDQQGQAQGQNQPGQPNQAEKLSDRLLDAVREANAQSAANLLSKGGGRA
ncbi:hypothetical protein [Streptomyces sp. 6N223]|uniref:hypothetical protein n=1 Tax=Streptomyces sp. 6N223 TaxID=3457412 RepID=UPI003FD50FDA